MDFNDPFIKAYSTPATTSNIDDLDNNYISFLLDEQYQNKLSDKVDSNDFKYYDITLDSLLNLSMPNNTITSSLQDVIQITLDSAFSDRRDSLVCNSCLENDFF